MGLLLISSTLTGCAQKSVYLKESDKVYFPEIGSQLTYRTDKDTLVTEPVTQDLICIGKGNLVNLQKEAGDKTIASSNSKTDLIGFLGKLADIFTSKPNETANS